MSSFDSKTNGMRSAEGTAHFADFLAEVNDNISFFDLQVKRTLFPVPPPPPPTPPFPGPAVLAGRYLAPQPQGDPVELQARTLAAHFV